MAKVRVCKHKSIGKLVYDKNNFYKNNKQIIESKQLKFNFLDFYKLKNSNFYVAVS